MAKKTAQPQYGDTDSVFLTTPAKQKQVQQFVTEIKTRFNLELAYDRKYDVWYSATR